MDFLEQNNVDFLAEEEKVPAVYGPQAKEDAAYTSMMGGRKDIAPHAALLEGQLHSDGKSAEVEQAKTNANIRHQKVSRRQLEEILSNPDVSAADAQAALEQYQDQVNIGTDLATETGIDLAKQELNAEISAMRQANMRDLIYGERTDAKLEAWETFSQEEVASPLKWAGDFLEIMLPFAEAKTIVGVAEELGMETSLKDYMLYGTKTAQIQNKMRSLSPERQREFAYKIKNYLDNHSGFFGGNDAMAYFYADALIENPNPDTAMELLDNVIGMIDVAGIAKIGMKAVKYYGKSVKNLNEPPAGSPFKIIGIANPAAQEHIAIRGLLNERDEALAAYGVTRAQLTSQMLPKVTVGLDTARIVESLPAKVAEGVNHVRHQMKLHAAQGRTPKRLILDAEAEVKAAAEGKMALILNDLGKTLPVTDELYTKANIASSPIEVVDDGFKINTIMQPESGKGWTSRGAMVNDVMAKLRGSDVEGLDFWFKPADSTKWEKVDGKLPKIAEQRAGEWAYSLNIKVDDDPIWKAALGPDYVRAYTGRVSKYIFGPHGMFDKNIMNPATVARDRQASMETRMQKIVADSAKRIEDKKAFHQVMDALQEGDRVEKVFTPAELREQFGIAIDSGAMQAYYEFRAVQDELWALANEDTRRLMLKEGWQSLYDKAGNIIDKPMKPLDLEIAAKVVEKPIVVYNVTRNSLQQISGFDELEKLYGKGAILGRRHEAYRPIKEVDDVYEYVLVQPNQKTRIGNLTHTPLKYRHGHISRIYKDNEFFVQLKGSRTAKVNGRESTRGHVETVAVTGSRKEAEAFIAKHTEYDGELSILDRKDAIKHMSKEELDYERLTGGYMSAQKRRGDRLLNHEGSHAAIENPLEAMARTINAVSHREAVKPFFDSQAAAWMKTFGAPHGYEKFPISISELDSFLKQVTDPTVRAKARAHWQFINMVRGMPSEVSQVWKSYMLTVAEILDHKNFPGASLLKTLASKAADTAPMNSMKKAAFNLFIALNPIKHLLLQPTQMVQMSILHPVYATTGFIADFSDVAMVLISGGKFGSKKGQELAKEFEKTGLLDAVQKHVFLNPGSEALHSPLAPQFADIGTKAMRGAGQSIAVPRKGFEYGENINILGHWLFARHRWMQKNPGKSWKTQKASAQIQADARDISLNFSPAGKMGYQDWGTTTGAFSSMLLQFFSHSHKMLMSMWPQFAGGSRAFTKAEKIKLATGNTLIFGATVWPIVSDYVDDMIAQVDPEMSPEKAQLIKTGMSDYLVSQALSIAAGEKVDVRPQKSLAPMGNIDATLHTFVDVLTQSPEYRPYVSAPIATIGVGMDTWDVLTTAWAMDDEIFTNQDIFLRTLHTMAEISPAMGHITQTTVAIQTGKLNSKFGNEVGSVNTAEALWKLTGFQTGLEADIYSARDKLFSLKSVSGGKTSGKGREAEIESEVTDLFRGMNRIMKTSDMSDSDKAMLFTRQLMLMYNTPKEKKVAYRTISKLSRSMMQKGEENFWSGVIREIYKSPAAEEYRTFTQYLNAPEGVEATLDALKESRGGLN